jgi:saccharopepsin
MGDNVIVGPGDGFDIVLGTPYLRNVYSVYGPLSSFIISLLIVTSIRYNFGNPFASDSKGPTPYMQFLSTTNPQTAAADAVASRKATLSQMAPEVSPQDYVNYLKSNSGTSGSTLDVATTKADSESTVEKYAPAVIGLLAANLLVGLVLIVLAVLGCVRRGSRGAPNSSAPSYVPVKLKEEDHTDTSYHMPYATR